MTTDPWFPVPRPLDVTHAEAAARLNIQAFEDFPPYLAVYPNGASEPTIETDAARIRGDIQRGNASETHPGGPTAWYTCVLDEKGGLVCHSLWILCKDPAASEGSETVAADEKVKEEGDPAKNFKPSPEANLEAWNSLTQIQTDARNRIMSGRGEYLYLATISTAETARGKGCATAVLKWGAAKAKQLGVIAHLSASDKGKSLYLKEGWKIVDENITDLSRFQGRNGVDIPEDKRIVQNTWMILDL